MFRGSNLPKVTEVRGSAAPRAPLLLQYRLRPHLCGNFLGAHTQTCLVPPGPPGLLQRSSKAESKLRRASSQRALTPGCLTIDPAWEGRDLLHKLSLAPFTRPPSVEARGLSEGVEQLEITVLEVILHVVPEIHCRKNGDLIVSVPLVTYSLPDPSPRCPAGPGVRCPGSSSPAMQPWDCWTWWNHRAGR